MHKICVVEKNESLIFRCQHELFHVESKLVQFTIRDKGLHFFQVPTGTLTTTDLMHLRNQSKIFPLLEATKEWFHVLMTRAAQKYHRNQRQYFRTSRYW